MQCSLNDIFTTTTTIHRDNFDIIILSIYVHEPRLVKHCYTVIQWKTKRAVLVLYGQCVLRTNCAALRRFVLTRPKHYKSSIRQIPEITRQTVSTSRQRGIARHQLVRPRLLRIGQHVGDVISPPTLASDWPAYRRIRSVTSAACDTADAGCARAHADSGFPPRDSTETIQSVRHVFARLRTNLQRVRIVRTYTSTCCAEYEYFMVYSKYRKFSIKHIRSSIIVVSVTDHRSSCGVR